MTRLSSYFLPTEREAPADAEAISHILMVRAGLIRQVGSGLWSWLPAGWRVHQKVVQIVREEMNAIGGQEMLMPVLQPAEPPRGTGTVARADVVLVPALAVDRSGFRLGRGGGSYDRALARVGEQVPVIALLYDHELVDAVPVQEHDRPVRAVARPGHGVTWLPE